MVDLESDLILAAPIYPADRSDQDTLAESLVAAQIHLVNAETDKNIQEVTTDKGYHKAETLADCEDLEKVLQTAPGSRHAELAQVRLAQLQGTAATQQAEYKKR